MDKKLEQWFHIPPSGTRAILHSKEGLGIKSISHLNECHGICHITSRIKAEKIVDVALDQRLNHEKNWSRKGLITVKSEGIYQSVIQDNKVDINNIKSVKTKVKKKHSRRR